MTNIGTTVWDILKQTSAHPTCMPWDADGYCLSGQVNLTKYSRLSAKAPQLDHQK